MNLLFTDTKANVAFSTALNESQVVRNWITQKLGTYIIADKKVTMEVMIDPWTKTEKPSYAWAIYSEEVDGYGLVISGCEKKHILNGGLIYRGDDNYSSHT